MEGRERRRQEKKEFGKQRMEQGGKKPHQSTHPGHRRPLLFWNQKTAHSRPACGYQRTCQGHHRSAPLGTCPSGLKTMTSLRQPSLHPIDRLPPTPQPFTTPHHHHGQRPIALLSLTIQRRQAAVGEVRMPGPGIISVTIHQQDSPIALGAPVPGFLWQNRRSWSQWDPRGWEEVLDVAKASHFVSLATFVSWVCLKI